MNYKRRLTLKPKTIFLIDSLGALATAFLLFVILRSYNEYVGMPQIILTYLSLIAAFFCLYSTTCFLVVKDNWLLFLRIIIIANILYCLLTMGLVIFYLQSITVFGLIYFFAETIVVSGLVFVEVKTLEASRQKKGKTSKLTI